MIIYIINFKLFKHFELFKSGKTVLQILQGGPIIHQKCNADQRECSIFILLIASSESLQSISLSFIINLFSFKNSIAHIRNTKWPFFD